MAPELKFDSVLPKEIPVILGEKRYTLRQSSGLVTDAYKKKIADCTTITDGKVTLSDPGKGFEAGKFLLSSCLFDSEGKLVSLDEIQSWVGDISDTLVEACIELHPNLSGKKIKEVDAKNS